MIEVEGVCKAYGAVKAVAGVSLHIRRGEVFGLLGPNGAGKSTLIRLITGLAFPDAGSCRIDGLDVAARSAEVKRRFGVVPQENNLDRELSVRENLLCYGRLHALSDLPRRIDGALARVGLADRAGTLVTSLSGGMKRRLLIARVLMGDPAILFLDEPSIGLDPQVRRQLWQVIRQVRAEGKTVLLTTHYIEEAEALCDRVGIMAQGRLVALDGPAELKARVGPFVAEAVSAEGRLAQRMARDRDEAHALAREMEGRCTVRPANLEDVFVSLTGERIE